MRIGLRYCCLTLMGPWIACGWGSALAESVVVGDAALQATVEYGTGGIREASFLVDGRPLPGLAAEPWAIETDAGTITPASCAREGDKAPSDPAGGVSFRGSLDTLDWRLDYRVSGPGRITRTLTVVPKKAIVLKEALLWRGTSGTEPLVSRTRVQDIAAFYRHGRHGLFVSLDFPYSRITTAGETTTVAYPPHDVLEAGRPYTCHSLTTGVTRLAGKGRYGFDDGEVDAMDSYVQEHVTPRFNRPMNVISCINNRYTMPAPDMSDGVFYTMKDHPTLSFHHDLLKREIELMSKLGIEYYQLWPGPFDAVPGDPDPAFVKDIVSFAKRRGVRVGDYSSVNLLFCYHYNDYKNSLENHPEWGLKSSEMCLGNTKYVDFYRDMTVANDRRYGFEVHCLDFLLLQECNNPEHGHALGRDSLYAQVRGLVEILEGINSVSPQMMTWSNAGDWGELLPKLAWYNHNLYLTDPFIASPWQGLNQTRLLDDARREQMVSLHNSRFIPYRYLSNCQYFFCQNSIVPEIRNYQYGALSTVAVTPNLSLGEIRPWLDTLPAGKQAEVISFYRKWTSFLTKNYALWKKTCHLGDNPGMGALEIYGHADGDHGFVFLVNPNYWNRTATVPLDSSLGFEGTGRVEIAELHPVERLVLTKHGLYPSLGSRLPVEVPAQTVMVLEVRPAPHRLSEPRLYGLPGRVETSKGGLVLKTRGQQGTTHRCAVVLPDEGKQIDSIEVRDYPKQPKRQWAATDVKPVASSRQGITLDITFRRAAAPTELREWDALQGTLEQGTSNGWIAGFTGGIRERFPLFSDVDDETVAPPLWDEQADKAQLGPVADFCGAYVENAFSEIQETWIDLGTGAGPAAPEGELRAEPDAPRSRPLPELARNPGRSWWLQTSFHLPFMYVIGCEPFFDEHTFVVLPFLRHTRPGQVKAWINGAPLDVRKYTYPRNRSMFCYYADLVGTGAKGGDNKLVVYFERE